MKVRCLLVDDEPPAVEILRNYIQSVPMLEIAGQCQHAQQAFDFLQQHEVDLIFLDIQMPGLLGTDLARIIPKGPKIIFTTAHRDYALEGFDLNAVDYLLKPISMDRFLKSVHKALSWDAKPNQSIDDSIERSPERFLYFRSDRKMVKVMVPEIQYIESLKDYVKIYTDDHMIITKQTITAVGEMLPEDSFARVHRSFIVAINKVESFTPQTLYIRKAEIPIGPIFRNEVIKRLTPVPIRVTHD